MAHDSSSCSSSDDEEDDNAFDEERYLLAMQFQTIAGRRRLGVSDLWLVWSLLRLECYDVNARDNRGIQPIVYAAQRGRIVLIWMLLQYNADINALSTLRESALIAACRTKRLRTIQFLLERGASPDFVDRTGRSALRWAVEHASLRMLRLLLVHNASVMKDCYTSNSALDVALRGATPTHVIMVDVLQQRLVNERRALLVQVTLRTEQDEVAAIQSFRNKHKHTAAVSAPPFSGTGMAIAPATQSGVGSTRKHATKMRVRSASQQTSRAKIHVTASNSEQSMQKQLRVTSASAASDATRGVARLSMERLAIGNDSSDKDSTNTGVWARVGRGKWQRKQREAPGAATATTSSSAATQVVAFDATCDGSTGNTGDTLATSSNSKRVLELLQSDTRWNAFHATHHDHDLGHDDVDNQQLAVEDLE